MSFATLGAGSLAVIFSGLTGLYFAPQDVPSTLATSSSALPAPVVVLFFDYHIEIANASSIEVAVSAALRQDALGEAQLGALLSSLRLEVDNNQ